MEAAKSNNTNKKKVVAVSKMLARFSSVKEKSSLADQESGRVEGGGIVELNEEDNRNLMMMTRSYFGDGDDGDGEKNKKR